MGEIGHAVEFVGILLVLVGATVRLEGRMSRIETKVDLLWSLFKKRAETIDLEEK